MLLTVSMVSKNTRFGVFTVRLHGLFENASPRIPLGALTQFFSSFKICCIRIRIIDLIATHVEINLSHMIAICV